MKTRFRVTLTVEAPAGCDEEDVRWHFEDAALDLHLTDIEVEREPEEPSLSVEARQ
jgi:hypothetical protein